MDEEISEAAASQVIAFCFCPSKDSCLTSFEIKQKDIPKLVQHLCWAYEEGLAKKIAYHH